MSNKVLVAFAMKEELAPWRRRHHFQPVPNMQHVSVTSVGATEVYVALVGAASADASWLDDRTKEIKPSVGIITGVAAGLRPQWRPADILVAHTITEPRSKSSIGSNEDLTRLAMRRGAKPATLVTVPRIARTMNQKIQIARMADAADMESFQVMKLWADRKIPSVALRVILDPVETPMTCDFEAAMDSHGQLRIAKILGQLARNPSLLPDFLHLAKQSRRVLNILAEFLDQFLGEYDRESRSPVSEGLSFPQHRRRR